MIHFTPSEILSAYKKFKHYFYYDNTSLFVRQKITSFEEVLRSRPEGTIEEKLVKHFTLVARDISSLSLKKWRDRFKDSIEIKATVKSLEKQTSNILTNTNRYASIQLQRCNFLIDASVEIHIITVLWLMYCGKYLAKVVDEDCYAYKLALSTDELDEEKEEVINGLKLYQPYFKGYQNWRDNAITKVQQLFEEKKDSTLLSLDIKDYYHNAVVDLSQIKSQLYEYKKGIRIQDNSQVERLFDLLSLIHEVYIDKISKYITVPILKKNESILPIGLLSSGLLGNIVLKEFDKVIKEKINPSYYGRYVDDILLVTTNFKVEETAISPVNKFLCKYFVERGLFGLSNVPKEFKPRKTVDKEKYIEPNIKSFSDREIIYHKLLAEDVKFYLKTNSSLEIQSKKVILQNFNSLESPAIINKFKKNIDKNRSEFRFLPEEDKIESEFDEEAFYIHYNDSINKLRSIKEFSEDKYGASKYLAGKIFVATYTNEKPDDKTITQILTFFKGRQALVFYTLWEKVATYLFITEEKEALVKFILQCEKAIEAIKIDKYEILDKKKLPILSKVQADMYGYLYLSIATPLALNPKYLTPKDINPTRHSKIFKHAIDIRKANLLRHQILEIPVLNYTALSALENNTFNLLKSYEGIRKSEFLLKENENSFFDFSCELSILSPRYIHYHELTIFETFKIVNLSCENDEAILHKIEKLNEQSFINYWRINHKWKTFLDGDPEDEDKIKEKQNSYFYQRSVTKQGSARANYISIRGQESTKKINKVVALANIKIEQNNIKNSYLGKPNTSKKRRELFFKLLNLVEEAKAEILILPEVSIPYKWMLLLASQAQKRNIAIVAGLEHWTNAKKLAFNFVASFLPIEKSKFRTTFVRIRLKNHYSHEEIKSLKGYRLLIPTEIDKQKERQNYDLFHWQGVYFSVYNCFELADIHDRALFKGQADFIIASEYNRDTNYFSEIAGSWVRDIHAFFIQVNTSDYGDSRLIQPASTEVRDIVRIKGGENSTIVVASMPIVELRDFQYKEYELQKEDGRFKVTPPDFERKFVEVRINNDRF